MLPGTLIVVSICCLYDKIELCVKLLVAAAKFTQDICGIVIVPLMAALFILMFISIWAGATITLIDGISY